MIVPIWNIVDPGAVFVSLILLLSNHVDVKTVQTRLGHASPSITLSWYAYVISENDRTAANLFGGIMNGKGSLPTL